MKERDVPALGPECRTSFDAGLQVGAIAWPVGGGHHYAATLTFPRLAADGADLLEGAAGLRLIIRDTDVPERVFAWEVAP